MKIKMGTNKELVDLKSKALALDTQVDVRMKKFNVQQSAVESTVESMLVEVKKITSKIPGSA